jgi:hypothetical protein
MGEADGRPEDLKGRRAPKPSFSVFDTNLNPGARFGPSGFVVDASVFFYGKTSFRLGEGFLSYKGFKDAQRSTFELFLISSIFGQISSYNIKVLV